MTLAAALLLLAAQGAQTSPGASTAKTSAGSEPRIEVRAMTLEKALPQIGEKLGVPMRAAPAIGRELVLVSFASTDAKAFREQLAKTFAGEWTQDENGIWFFNRSATLRAAEAKADRVARLEAIRKSLATARKRAAPDSSFDGAAAEGLVKDLKSFIALPQPKDGTYDAGYYRKARGLDARSPSTRIVRRIIEKLPIETFDNVDGNKRIVYSTRPTKMQLPMPFDILPEVRRFTQEQNMWAETMSSAGIPEPTGGMYTNLMYRKDRVEKVPAVVLLVLKDEYGSSQVTVKAYDAAGKQILDQGESVNTYDEEAAESAQKKLKEMPRKVKVDYAPESKRFAEVFDMNAARRKTRGITPADLAPYLDVVNRDPLSYASSDIAFAIARGEGRNLIARLDDTFFYLTFASLEPEVSKNNEMDASVLEYFTTSVEENGWTRMTPKNLNASARSSYDRRDLARALALVAQGGRMSVERQAELALITPDGAEQRPMYRLVNLVAGTNSWNTDDFLRLYGTLTPEQRKAANREGGIPFAGLSAASMAILNKLAYQSDEWRLQYSPSEALRAKMTDGRDNDQELFWGGYLREPTFSLPDGVPTSGRLTLVSSTLDKVKTGPMSRRWGQQEGEIMTAEYLAETWYQSANPRRFPWSQDEYSRKNFDVLTLVNQQSVEMEVRFDDRITASTTLTSDVPIEGGPFTLKSLPQSFREAFDKKIKELDEMYKDQPLPDPSDYQRNQGGGGGTPPPAR